MSNVVFVVTVANRAEVTSGTVLTAPQHAVDVDLSALSTTGVGVADSWPQSKYTNYVSCNHTGAVLTGGKFCSIFSHWQIVPSNMLRLSQVTIYVFMKVSLSPDIILCG